MRRFLFILLLAAVFLPAVSYGQTLAQLLTAVQNRKQLEIERQSLFGGTATSQLISWGEGIPNFPTDANLAIVSLENQFKALKKASEELDKLNYYYDPRKLKDGFGALARLTFDPIGRIDLDNFEQAVQVLARRVSRMKTLYWNLKWTYKLNDWSSEEAGFSNAHIGLVSSGGVQHPETYQITDAYQPYFYRWVRWRSITDYPPPSEDEPAKHTGNTSWLTDLKVEGKGATHFPSNIQIFNQFGWGVLLFDNVTIDNAKGGETLYGPASQLWVDKPLAAGASLAQTEISGFLGGSGEGSSESVKGYGEWTEDDVGDAYYTQQSFRPKTTLKGYGADFGHFLSWVMNPMIEKLGTWDDEEAVYPASCALTWRSLLTVNFSSEFSSGMSAAAPPEEMSPIQIVPELDRGRLRVRLAGSPANECDLIWRFPDRITTHAEDEADTVWGIGALYSRRNLDVIGCGDWEAVYSGRSTDREPLQGYPGALDEHGYPSFPPYQRWKTFVGFEGATDETLSYMKDWWRPVLTQLVTATYALNVTQIDGFSYRIEFYRRDQASAVKNAIGRYEFAGDPIKTITVQHGDATPDADKPGHVRLTVHDPTVASDLAYDVSLVQSKDGNGAIVSDWTLNAKAGATTFLEQSVKVEPPILGYYSPGAPTYTYYYFVTTPLKVTTTNRKLDGVSLPNLTAKYLDTWANPDHLAEFKEEGSDGTRTTTFTYTEKDPNTHEIQGLQQVVQTGGVNPYTATYDPESGLIKKYKNDSTSWEINWDYGASGSVVTRTEKPTAGAAPVRTDVTTYTIGLSRAVTKIYRATESDTTGALDAIVQYYPGTDAINPWGLKLVRGADGATSTFSYAWSGSNFVTTMLSREGDGTNSETVTAGTKEVTAVNKAGKVVSWEVYDLPSNAKLDFATASTYQAGATLFPSQYSRPLGRKESYVYDGQGRVTSHVDLLGKTTSYSSRDALGRLKQVTRAGANGNLTWNISYNNDLPVGHTGYRVNNSTIGFSDRSEAQSASPFGKTAYRWISGPENVTVTRTENSGNITTVVSNTTTNRNFTQAVTKSTLATTLSGSAVSLTASGSDVWNTTYSPANGQWTTANSSLTALAETTTADPLGRITQRIAPGGNGGTATTGYTYANGRLAGITPPSGQGSTFAYAADGTLSGITRGSRFLSVARVGTALKWQATASGPDGTEILWERSYNATTGAKTETPRAVAARAFTTTPTYSGDELTLTTTGPAWSRVLKWKDGAFLSGVLTEGSLVTGLAGTVNPFGERSSFTVKPGNGSAAVTYDNISPLGFPASVNGLAGTGNTTFSAPNFTGGGLTLTATRNSHAATASFAPSGQLLAATGYGRVDQGWGFPVQSGGAIQRTLTAADGTLVPNATYTSNPSGTLKTRGFPDGTSEGFTYTASGDLDSLTLPSGGMVGLAANAYGEPTEVVGGGSRSWNNAGTPSVVADLAGTHTLTYTEGKPKKESHSGGPLVGQWIEHAYDAQGQLSGFTLSGNVALGYTTTAAGEITALTTAGGLGASFTNYSAVSGRPQNFACGPLTVVTTYDDNKRVTSVTNKISGTAIATYGYTYNADQRVATQTVTIAPAAASTITYGYDSKGQLASASGGQTASYAWDVAGRAQGLAASNDYRPVTRVNPATVEVSGSVTTTGSPLPTVTIKLNAGTPAGATVTGGKFSANYTGLSGWQTFTITGAIAGAGLGGTAAIAEEVRQIFVPPASESLTYDTAANLTGDARWTNTWDAGNRLTRQLETSSISGVLPLQIDYLYDWLGRRVEKKVSSKAVSGTLTQIKRTTWLYDAWRPVREIEYNAANQEVVRRTYTWGPDFTGKLSKEGAGVGGLVEIYEQPRFGTATRTLPYYDCNQNVVGAVDGTTGAKVAEFSYGPFGELLSATGSRVESVKFRYQTRYRDEETGFYNFNFRILDPKTGFLSRDPLHEASGDINDRRYCLNDPLRNHDPLGLWPMLGGVDWGNNDQRNAFGISLWNDTKQFGSDQAYYAQYYLAQFNYVGYSLLGGVGQIAAVPYDWMASQGMDPMAFGPVGLEIKGIGAAANGLRMVGIWGKAQAELIMLPRIADTIGGNPISFGGYLPWATQNGKIGSPLSLGAAKGLTTGTDEAVFWSGIGRGGADKAAAWVGQSGGATLETTLAARGIKLPVWDASNSASVAAWRQASKDFAAGASGNVRVLQGDALRLDAIWVDEFRALQANPNVNSIMSLNPDTGANVLLWSR